MRTKLLRRVLRFAHFLENVFEIFIAFHFVPDKGRFARIVTIATIVTVVTIATVVT